MSYSDEEKLKRAEKCLKIMAADDYKERDPSFLEIDLELMKDSIAEYKRLIEDDKELETRGLL